MTGDTSKEADRRIEAIARHLAAVVLASRGKKEGQGKTSRAGPGIDTHHLLSDRLRKARAHQAQLAGLAEA